jgi:long-chain acyl-CoA synthetase
LPPVKVVPKDCYTFSYTSGTTGDPKGAMLSHENLMSVIAGAQSSSLNLKANDVHLSYLPLPHILERLVVCALIYYGAAIGFYSGDVLKMKEDLLVLKPTLFVSVPRIYNKFYAKIKGTMDEAKGCKKCLVTKAINAKMTGLKKNATYTNGLWDALVFKKTKDILGG